ncbi:MAG TPA: peptidoglycan-associated lipoprotein Pal [Methylomirabilota bacterium]|nr:peptidoglycan-associated lipoprotein Pal [Methylomirabilota bacterium]
MTPNHFFHAKKGEVLVMVRRWQCLTIIPVLGLALFLVGCPKRPATTTAAAPPPSTSPQVTAPAPSAGTGPSGPVTSTPSPTPARTPSPAPQVATPTPPPAPSEFVAVPGLRDVHFDFDKSDIRAGDAKILEANAQWLKDNSRNLLLVEGHADERGTNEYNLALGERRAKSAMNYLVSLGVAANRITIISYGEERPFCAEHNENCWAKNRRAHFLTKRQ